MTTAAEDIDQNAEQLGARRVEVLQRFTKETGEPPPRSSARRVTVIGEDALLERRSPG